MCPPCAGFGRWSVISQLYVCDGPACSCEVKSPSMPKAWVNLAIEGLTFHVCPVCVASQSVASLIEGRKLKRHASNVATEYQD